jgi:glycyl-tRNA synthetase
LDYDILFLEGSILANEHVWKASGHLANFQDPMIDCLVCKLRYRTDEIDINKVCPNCKNLSWSEVKDFNLMFSTNIGATIQGATTAYLRPETAQSIFINFKNIISSYRVKIPFAIAQIGKSFRNEITPKQFLFRMREFEQMELEFFCKQEDAEKFFLFWCTERLNFYNSIGINSNKIRLRAHEKNELSHYSQYTSDIEYNFPFGWKELEGIAYRGDFDLTQHSQCSNKDLSIYDENEKRSYIPHVVECSAGTDRLFLTILFDAYHEELLEDTRIVLKLDPKIAPYKASFMPLSKELSDNMYKIYLNIKHKGYSVQFDNTGSIGKRYRRQDEIGTPICFTYDFESINDNKITARDRDTMKQERISIDKIEDYIKNIIK